MKKLANSSRNIRESVHFQESVVIQQLLASQIAKIGKHQLLESSQLNSAKERILKDAKILKNSQSINKQYAVGIKLDQFLLFESLGLYYELEEKIRQEIANFDNKRTDKKSSRQKIEELVNKKKKAIEFLNLVQCSRHKIDIKLIEMGEDLVYRIKHERYDESKERYKNLTLDYFEMKQKLNLVLDELEQKNTMLDRIVKQKLDSIDQKQIKINQEILNSLQERIEQVVKTDIKIEADFDEKKDEVLSKKLLPRLDRLLDKLDSEIEENLDVLK